MIKYLTSISLLFSLSYVFSQPEASDTTNCEQVLVKGKVYDTVRPQGFYNLMLVNTSKGHGVFGLPNGSFSLYTKPGDTIAISVKEYLKRSYVVIPDSNCQFIIDLPMQSKVQELDEVIIYPLKSLEEIKKEREELSMRETRTVTGVDVFQSPVTALYERFSKTAKAKKRVAEMEHQDNINSVLRELLRIYVSHDVVGLQEEYFEDFVEFLNIDEAFLRTSTDYELIVFIKDKLEHYKFFHPERFDEVEEVEEDNTENK